MENSTDTMPENDEIQASETEVETAEAEGAPRDEAKKPDDFDPDKARRLIENLRGDKARLKAQRDELAARVAELEKAHKQLSESAARAAELELELAKYDIAAEKGIPRSLLRFLHGTTREELEQAADALLEGVGQMKPRVPDLKQGNRGSAIRQLTKADLKGMTNEEIVRAYEGGQMADLLRSSSLR